MDFINGLPILIDWKGDSYNFILVIINWLTKIVHYQPVKITIDALGLAKVVIDVIVNYHGLLGLIVINKGLFFISKFMLLLCCFLSIKQRLFLRFTLRLTVILSNKIAQ